MVRVTRKEMGKRKVQSDGQKRRGKQVLVGGWRTNINWFLRVELFQTEKR